MAAAQWISVFRGISFSMPLYREQGKEIYCMLCIAQQPAHLLGHVFSGLRRSQTVPAHGDPVVLFQICA